MFKNSINYARVSAPIQSEFAGHVNSLEQLRHVKWFRSIQTKLGMSLAHLLAPRKTNSLGHVTKIRWHPSATQNDFAPLKGERSKKGRCL